MITLKLIYWITLLTVFYSYLSYGIMLFIIYKLKSLFVKNEILCRENFEPAVSLIIAAYNEAPILIEKIINS